MPGELGKLGNAEWLIRVYDKDPQWVESENGLILVPHPEAKLLYEEKHENMIVRLGRKDVLLHLFNVGAPINTGFLYMGAGSGFVAAAVTDTALGTELIGNASRLTVTNISGAALSATDVVQETSGGYDQKIVVQAVYPTGDLNNGSNFREYGLFSSATFAAGTMFNRYVAASNILKDSSTALTIQTTIRT